MRTAIALTAIQYIYVTAHVGQYTVRTVRTAIALTAIQYIYVTAHVGQYTVRTVRTAIALTATLNIPQRLRKIKLKKKLKVSDVVEEQPTIVGRSVGHVSPIIKKICPFRLRR